MTDWNSNQYIKFEKERTQPSIDLIRRIDIIPKKIIDIGCGPGNSTNQLFERFPNADILGVDNSENMLDKAQKMYSNLKFCKYSIPEELDKIDNSDLIFSNACLHWIPEHRTLFPKLMSKLNDGGVLAVQMPLVQEAIFYKLLNEIAAEKRWEKLQQVHNFHNLAPEETYDILSKVSSKTVMWSTTYYHIVDSHKAVIDWYAGSGLRTYLEMLNNEEKEVFLEELLEKINTRYPVRADGNVILKMPRLFFLAIK